jgi:hypothetical protein
LDADVKKRSVTKDDSGGGGIWHWMLSPSYGAPGDLPTYWSPGRDSYLRDLLYQPFHDFWVGAISIAITKMSSLGWNVEGDTPTLRSRSQDLLMTFFDEELSKHLQDFLCTDNGAFVEIVRATRGAGSRIIGLVHLDSLRVTRTGDPDIPLLYRDTKNVEHELKDYQVMLYSDMPSSAEMWNGVGLCATSRAWGTVKKLESIEQYIYEKVSGKRPKALDLVGGVSENQLRQGVESAEEDSKKQGYVKYMGAIVVPTLSDIEITHTRINFAELPEEFDYEKQFNNSALLIANAIGLDTQDLQPLTGRSLGTSMQSEVLHEKSRGKGLAAWRQQMTHSVNDYVLPDSITFAFSENDARETQQRAETMDAFATAVATMITSQVITAPQGAQILADEEIIPKEFIPEDTTPTETLEDSEKPGDEESGQAEDETPVAEETPAEQTVKSRRDVAQEYKGQLYEFTNKAMRGQMSAVDMARAHRELVRTLGPAMYTEALKANGISEEEMDEADRSEIDGWIAGQLPYVRDFANATTQAKTETDKSAIAGRIDYWVAALNELGQLGIASANKNAMGEWRIGKTEEHCKNCQELHGKKHRVKWYIQKGFIPREPGSETLECGGWACDCSVVADNGRRLL